MDEHSVFVSYLFLFMWSNVQVGEIIQSWMGQLEFLWDRGAAVFSWETPNKQYCLKKQQRNAEKKV